MICRNAGDLQSCRIVHGRLRRADLRLRPLFSATVYFLRDLRRAEDLKVPENQEHEACCTNQRAQWGSEQAKHRT